MKPDIKKVSRKCDDTDDEISFRDVNGDIDHEDGKSKIKRKSNTEKFLEDNANYFQLEVLNTKTRSNKLVNETEASECSVRLPRLALTRPGRSDSPSEDSDS